jgi:predicted transcriptional regulator
VHSGRVVPLVANLIEQSRLTPEEVAELRKLLEEAEKRAASPRKKRP